MKLLFDENLSHRLCRLPTDAFPDSAHVRDFNLQAADDLTIWDFAREQDYLIVSRDEDFQQRSFVYGHPPKVVWVRLGNVSTVHIANAMRSYKDEIEAFITNENASFLVLS